MGSKAAIAGGTGALIDFVTPKRGQSLIEATEARLKETEASSVPIKLHVGITWWDDSLDAEIEILIKDFGIKTFKVYMAYLDNIGLEVPEMHKAMESIAKHGGIMALHAELGIEILKLQYDFIQDGKTIAFYHQWSRPPYVEFEAVEKALLMVEFTKCPTYFVHLSTAESVQMIREAKAKGLPVYAETCPHYLLLDDQKYMGSFKEIAPYIMSPPLRPKKNQDALWAGLKDGTLDTISTDHCPFTMKQKSAGINDFTKIPNGVGGIYHRMGLIYTYGVLENRISLNECIKLCSSNAAEIFDFENYGNIEEGEDAPVFIWNPEPEEVIGDTHPYSNADTNLYKGLKIKGKAIKISEL
jgi:dihydropyrimidinase